MIGGIPPRSAQATGTKPQWTLLYYLNGDNNLREEITRDLVRLHEEGTSPEVNAVAALYRGDWNWSLKSLPRKILQMVNERDMPPQIAPDWRGRQTFEVRRADVADSKTLPLDIQAEGQVKVSDWRQLRDFLVTNMNQFPAERYCLTVATHAFGDKGLLVDGSATAMPVEDFRKALLEAQEVTGKRLGVLTLEACGMGRPEMVDKLQGVADYLIASPQKIAANKAPYETLLARIKDNPTMSEAELAQTTQDTFSPALPGLSLFKL